MKQVGLFFSSTISMAVMSLLYGLLAARTGTEVRASARSGGRAGASLDSGEAGALRLLLLGLEDRELAAVVLSSRPNSSSISLATLFWKSYQILFLKISTRQFTKQGTYDPINLHFEARNTHNHAIRKTLWVYLSSIWNSITCCILVTAWQLKQTPSVKETDMEKFWTQ